MPLLLKSYYIFGLWSSRNQFFLIYKRLEHFELFSLRIRNSDMNIRLGNHQKAMIIV